MTPKTTRSVRGLCSCPGRAVSEPGSVPLSWCSLSLGRSCVWAAPFKSVRAENNPLLRPYHVRRGTHPFNSGCRVHLPSGGTSHARPGAAARVRAAAGAAVRRRPFSPVGRVCTPCSASSSFRSVYWSGGEPVAAGRVLDHLGGLGRVVVRAAEVDGPGVGQAGPPGDRGGRLDASAPAGPRSGTCRPGPQSCEFTRRRLFRASSSRSASVKRVDAALDEEADRVFHAGHVPQDAFPGRRRRSALIGSPVTGSVQMPYVPVEWPKPARRRGGRTLRTGCGPRRGPGCGC